MHPCILATCVVPWDERGVFLVEPFVRQVRSLAGALTRHLYLFGTAGEGYAVTDRQFDEIAGVFVDDAISSGIHAGVAENPQFKKLHDSYMGYRGDGYLWFQLSEYSFDTFMMLQQRGGKL
mgnify:CR=1 FL=1